jgi:DNA polymerase-3 subunit delta'
MTGSKPKRSQAAKDDADKQASGGSKTAPPPAYRGEPIGHATAKQWFANSLAKSRLGGTFLLVGPPGIGKAALAKWIAKALFCEQRPGNELAPCGHCPACAQVDAETHPDLVQVRKPEDRSYIPLELLIGPAESRMQEGFCRDIRLRPFKGTRKVAILHDADYMNEEGANSLLKTFEEPPPDAVIFLLGTSEQRQLPTIRSRCQIVRLHPPHGEDAVALMRLRGIERDADTIERAIELCGGDCDAAASLLTEEGAGVHAVLVKELSQANISAVALAQMINGVMEDLGKAPLSSVKRDRLREVFAVAVHTFRQRLVKQADRPDLLPPTIYRLDRSIDAIGQVQRNANQATLIECWAADISRGFPA